MERRATRASFSGSDKKCFVKVVAIGDSGVGKTSLIQMFEHCKFTESFKPTIGADFSNKEITVNGRIVTLQIWDTAGQERYQSLGTAFYRGADCCLLVYDMTNQQSFENLANWKSSFLSKGMVIMPESFPFIVVGNKLDIEEENRQVSSALLQRFCQENGNMPYVETSAKNNTNVEQAFIKLAEKALARQEEISRKMEEHTHSQRAIEREKNKKLGHINGQKPKKDSCKC